MILFIASEVMFFVAWFWAYYQRVAVPVRRRSWSVASWPPKGIEVLDPFEIPLLEHLHPAALGHHGHLGAPRADRGGPQVAAKQGLWLTDAARASPSPRCQAYEYSHAAFGLAGNVYGSTFYMATGFHGFHVIIGTIFLAICLRRVYNGDFTPRHHFGFEAAAWYWHFVDVVWLFLFLSIYVLGSHFGAAVAHGA